MANKKLSLENLMEAFEDYKQVKDRCSQTGKWDEFADLFTKDCYYVEHAYGVFNGREAVRDYITRVMSPFPTMRFPIDWFTYDPVNHAVIWQVQNVFPAPNDPATNAPFQFPNLSRIVLAGKDSTSGKWLWKEEQDWYKYVYWMSIE
jgi:hypothetical protein